MHASNFQILCVCYHVDVKTVYKGWKDYLTDDCSRPNELSFVDKVSIIIRRYYFKFLQDVYIKNLIQIVPQFYIQTLMLIAQDV